MKKSRRLIIIGAVLGAAMLLAGCQKAQTYELDRSANYPITWTENKNGTVSVKLDGSHSAEGYTWEAVCSDETLVEVKAGKEKKGVITYQIKPIGEGSAHIEFKRSRPTEEIPVVPEVEVSEENDPPKDPEFEEVPDTSENVEEDPEYVQSGTMLTTYDEDGNEVLVPLFSEGDLIAPESEVTEDDFAKLEEIHEPEDVVCKFTLNIISEAKGKRKFTAKTAAGDFFEGEGLTVCSNGERFWRESENEIIVLVPPCEGIWLENDESTFSGKYYQELNEDGSVNEMKELPMPQIDDEGNPVVLEVSCDGDYRGYTVFRIHGLGEGTGEVTIGSPALKQRIIFNVSMDRTGVITIDSFREEEYTPSKEEMRIGVEDMKDFRKK